jgi:hypothetical protein
MARGFHQAGARLSVRDVAELNEASEALAAVAEQIKRVNPGWAPAAVQLLIQANETIVRIQNKGARAYAAWLERHGTQPAAAGADDLNASDESNQARNVPPGEG